MSGRSWAVATPESTMEHANETTARDSDAGLLILVIGPSSVLLVAPIGDYRVVGIDFPGIVVRHIEAVAR